VHIADQPVATYAAAAGEIVAAHCFCLPAKAMGEIGSVLTGHHAAPRLEMCVSDETTRRTFDWFSTSLLKGMSREDDRVIF
jgi:hypothetical protein